MTPALALTFAISDGAAQASSIVKLEDVAEIIGPSIIVLSETPGGPVVQTQEMDEGSTVVLSSTVLQSPSIDVLSEPVGQATPSVVVLGGPMSAPSEDAIANDPLTDTKKPVASALMPMVIRGGVVGNAERQPATSTVTQGEPQPVPLLDPNDKGTPAKRKALKRQAERLRAIEASTPPAPDTPMPKTE